MSTWPIPTSCKQQYKLFSLNLMRMNIKSEFLYFGLPKMTKLKNKGIYYLSSVLLFQFGGSNCQSLPSCQGHLPIKGVAAFSSLQMGWRTLAAIHQRTHKRTVAPTIVIVQKSIWFYFNTKYITYGLQDASLNTVLYWKVRCYKTTLSIQNIKSLWFRHM